MSKIICDVCGTSYTETATQCPICGCARPAECVVVSETEPAESGYTYVKGGRFSKANVRKRNQGVEPKKVTPKAPKESKPLNKKLIGFIIVITCTVLILSLLGVFIYNKLSGNQVDKVDNNTVQTVEIPCTEIKLSVRTFDITTADQSLNLAVTCTPLNTTDKVQFSSTNPEVVTVDEKGNITYVGNGKADIVVKCGTIEDKCTITCNVPVVDDPTEPEPTEAPTDPAQQLRFMTTLITTTDYFQCEPDTSYTLCVTQIPHNEILWYSDDPSIAEFRDGVVYMKAPGTTTVYAEYGDQKLSCTVIVGSGDGFNLLPPDTDIDLSNYTGWCKYGSGWKVSLSTVYCPIDGINYKNCIDVRFTNANEAFAFGIYELETGADIILSWQAVHGHDSVVYNEDTKVFTWNTEVTRGAALYKAQYGDETIYLFFRQ